MIKKVESRLCINIMIEKLRKAIGYFLLACNDISNADVKDNHVSQLFVHIYSAVNGSVLEESQWPRNLAQLNRWSFIHAVRKWMKELGRHSQGEMKGI